MKHPLIAGTLAALTLAAAGSAFAQTAPAPQAHPTRMARGDADRDGRLSRAEFVEARVGRLTAADADGDGSVSADERRAAAQAGRAERQAARFDRLDTDRNGALSREEFAADHSRRPTRARHGGGERRHAGHAGMQARGPVVIAEARAKTEQAFDRMDADHDGFVTADERRAARQAKAAERRERRAAREASPQPPASE